MTRLILCVCFLVAGLWAGAQTPTLTVKVFLGVDCPVSQKYMTRLNDLQHRYAGRGVEFEGLLVGKVTAKQLDDFSTEYQAAFPLKGDPKYELAKKYNARITPEVILIITNIEKIIYQGAIDNWFYELGRYRTVTTENYLADAIESVLKGEAPRIKKTEAIGCFIQLPSESKHKHPQ